tara:strand:+ start:263 stop:553 length:291 start_codon:yes stop_codon:yes gene_type:complete
MITAQDIMEKIDEALKMFGEYNYHDKGAGEVMDVREIVDELQKLTNEQILTTLRTVEQEHSDPAPFLMDCVSQFDNWKEQARVDELFNSELFQEWY